MDDMRKGSCPLCRHHEIIAALPGDFDALDERTLAVSYAIVDGARDARFPRGLLVAYICRRCGYLQWFADKPDEIPIGKRYKTRLVRGPSPRGPFR
jgi:hypothetical protein